jgi:hypothetical protein
MPEARIVKSIMYSIGYKTKKNRKRENIYKYKKTLTDSGIKELFLE